MTDLQPGWAVVGNDGRRLGTIKDVGQNYVLTSRGGRTADLAHREAERMGWQQPPRGDDELETTPESDLHRHI
jgi:hypothetical protein